MTHNAREIAEEDEKITESRLDGHSVLDDLFGTVSVQGDLNTLERAIFFVNREMSPPEGRRADLCAVFEGGQGRTLASDCAETKG